MKKIVHIKRKKQAKSNHQMTLFNQTLLSTHQICKCQVCIMKHKQIIQKHLQPKKQNIWDTNFGIQVKNDFIFLLLHLRNQNNKNPININIPQLAVFVQGLLYDMIYYQNGHIRSRRFIDQKKIRRVQIISFFTKVLKENLSEHYIVKLRQNQYLMLSEIDLTQLCYKNRFDPIWIKIQYIQNKVEVENYNYIKQLYDCDIQYPSELIKLATESLLGYINQKEIREQLSEQLYLVYVNLKIALFLNYKHNIRIKKCLFFYLKTKSQNQDYILINAENLQFTNLTEPLKKRNQRLQKQLQQRNKIIQMTPEKQQKIKKYINPQNISNIQQIQNQMNRHYEETINKLGMRSIGSQRNNDQKNDMAFTKLFPQCNKKLKEFISSDKFYQLKDELLGVKKRKGLIRSSNNRFYTFSKIKLSEEKKIKKNLTTFINKRYKTNHCGFFLTQNRLLDSSKGQLLDKTQISMNSII